MLYYQTKDYYAYVWCGVENLIKKASPVSADRQNCLIVICQDDKVCKAQRDLQSPRVLSDLYSCRFVFFSFLNKARTQKKFNASTVSLFM